MKDEDFIQHIRETKDLTNGEKKMAIALHNNWIMWVVGIIFAMGGLYVSFNGVRGTVQQHETKIETVCNKVNTMEVKLERIETKQDMMINMLKRTDR